MNLRFLFELFVFAAIAAVAVALVFILAVVLGSPFDIRRSQAAVIALIAVIFWFSAFANVHIAVTGKDGQLRRGRLCAALRAFGMLLASAAVGAGFLFSSFGLQVVAPLFLAGMILNFGTLPFEK